MANIFASLRQYAGKWAVKGGMTFIPMSNTSTKGVGESVDLNTAKLVTLGKEGESDIYRVEA